MNQVDEEEEPVKPLSDYLLWEIQELISMAHSSHKTEEDPIKRRLNKKNYLVLIRHYNKRVGFGAYKETI